MWLGQHFRSFCLVGLAVVVSFICFPVLGVDAPATNTTFDSNTKTYPELTNSISQVKQRLDIAEKAWGGSNTNVADLLSELAGLYDDLGDYAKASSMYQHSLSIRETVLGSQHMRVADSLNDLAWVYREMGDYDRALPLFKRSLVITEKQVGHDDFEFATTLSNIADVYLLKKDYAQALPLCKRALEIRRKAGGPEHPDLTDSLCTLAAIRRALGDYKEALALCKQSVAIGEKNLGLEHPQIAENLLLLGQIHRDLGNYADALSAYRRALAIYEKISGPENPDVLEVRSELAVLFGKQHEFTQSLAAFNEFFKRQRHYFVGQISVSSDMSALRSIQNSFQSAEIFHSFCSDAPAQVSVASWVSGAEELALNKAFLEEVRAAQAACDSDPRTTTKELRDQYRTIQLQLEHMTQGKQPLSQRDSNLHELQNELFQVETKLADRVELAAATIRERDLTLTGIARNLQPQSVLLDFVQYRQYGFAAKTNRWDGQRYAVYLTFPLTEHATNVVVKRVDLGAAAPINDAVELICRRMSAGQFAATDLPPVLHRMDELIYVPLAKHLTNISHLIICPDAQLSRLPFELLSHDGRFLIEDKTVSYVGSGREIVRLAQPRASTKTTAPLVIGNPDFDLDLTKSRSAGHQAVAFANNASPAPTGSQFMRQLSGLRFLSRDYHGQKFEPLPGAEAEAQSVAKLLGDDSALRIGADAREAELKAVVSPRVLHLATHGFFLSDQRFKAANGLRNKLLPEQDWENPLLRCGIALAGANHALQITNSTTENGLLTALDASLLNLQGTELVILSACDSGTGEVKIGEGVMSLRRAFRIAGAQTVLASHWNISDKATLPLMTEFIRRWRAGEPRAQAWREAQLALLHSTEFSNPYFWAAFTFTGQWR